MTQLNIGSRPSCPAKDIMKNLTKALVYITRHVDHTTQILVFRHQGMPEAGIQVPAGTVEPNESPENAAIREAKEETGLSNLLLGRKLLAVDYYHDQKKELQHRNYFEFSSPELLSENWTHKVTSGEEDEGLKFEFYWIPAVEAERLLAGRQGQAISKLINPAKDL